MKIVNNFAHICFSLLLLTTFYLLLSSSSHAVNMDSERYKIQYGNINIGGKKSSDLDDGTYNLSATLGQVAAGQFESNGYIVKAGFQYIYSKIPFTFSLSSIRADLGTLFPSTPSTTSIQLTVSYGGAGQYVVTAGEQGTMQNFSYDPIPNTTCNGGADTCSRTLAKIWTSTSSYGFGYSMSGEDIPADFIDSTYYRPFADLTVPEDPVSIMQSANVTQNLIPTPNPSYTPAPLLTGTPRDITHTSTLTFKANISPLQQAGSYTTVVHFTATPSF